MLSSVLLLVTLAAPPALAPLGALYPELDALYRDLHATPELSLQEVKTAAKLAERLKSLGFEVTTGVAMAWWVCSRTARARP
jgi:hippurate hydrolase